MTLEGCRESSCLHRRVKGGEFGAGGENVSDRPIGWHHHVINQVHDAIACYVVWAVYVGTLCCYPLNNVIINYVRILVHDVLLNRDC